MGFSILVVDDDEAVLSLIRRVFILAGFSVDAASCARDALAVLEDKPGIQLVMSDILMPQMNGVELIKKIHADYPDVITVAMTGGVSGLLQEQLEALECPVIFEKPFRHISSIVATLVGLLAKQEGSPFVLVADDDRDFRQYAEHVLQQRCYVRSVSSLESLEMTLETIEPDMLFYDSLGDCAETEYRINPYSTDNSKFVRVTSAPPGTERFYKGVRRPAILRKPINPDELVKMLVS
jgi:DNA-binding NtrC family response regulator